MRPTYSKVGVTRYYRGRSGLLLAFKAALVTAMTSLPQTITT
jgi:hypothetical protein